MLPLNQMHLQGYINSITRSSDSWRNPSSLVDACIKKLALNKVFQELDIFSEQWGFCNSICKSMWALIPSRTCFWAQERGHSRWNNKQLIFGSPAFFPWSSSASKDSKEQHAVCSSLLLVSPAYVLQDSSCLRCLTRDVSEGESSCWDVTG